jgi:peptidoglycan LD-endopeptidase LytH
MIRVFPVIGPAHFSDDFGYMRPDGSVHHAIDIMADEGEPLVAVDDGQVRFGSDPLGGNIANLYAQDGTRYYYAHLYAFAGTAPRMVTAGEVIGYVGSTGNAAGGPSHVHFAEYPGNGAPTNPHDALMRAPHAQPASSSPSAGKVLLAIGLLGVIVYTLGPTLDSNIKRLARAT